MNENTLKGLVGGIVLGALGVTGLTIGTGWAVPQGTAQKMATAEANSALVEEFAKICLFQYETSPELEAHNAQMKKYEVFQQREYITRRKFSVMPGSKDAYRDTADRCNELIVAKHLK